MKNLKNLFFLFFFAFAGGAQAKNISLQLNLTTTTDRLLSGSFTSANANLDPDMKGFQLSNPDNIVNSFSGDSEGSQRYAGFSLSGNTSIIKLVGQKYGAAIEIPLELVAFDASSSANGNDGTAVIEGTCKGSDLSHLVSPGVFKSVAKPKGQNFCTTSSHAFSFQDSVTPFLVNSANYQWKIKDGKNFSNIFNEKYYPADIYKGSAHIQSTEVNITNPSTGSKDLFTGGFILDIVRDNKPYINSVTTASPYLQIFVSEVGGNDYVGNGSTFISVSGALGKSLKVTPRSKNSEIGKMYADVPGHSPIPYEMEITSLNSGERFKLIDGKVGKGSVAEFKTYSIDDSLNMSFRLDAKASATIITSNRVIFTEDITLVFETNELF